MIGPSACSLSIQEDELTNEVAALEVESVQFIARLLCIHDILEDYESGALGVAGNSLTDLTISELAHLRIR